MKCLWKVLRKVDQHCYMMEHTYSHIIKRMNGSSTGRDIFENKTPLPHTNGLQPTLSLYRRSVWLKGCDWVALTDLQIWRRYWWVVCFTYHSVGKSPHAASALYLKFTRWLKSLRREFLCLLSLASVFITSSHY